GDEPVPVGRARSAAMLDHELLKNDLAVTLQLLDAQGAIELLRWETARDALADAVHLMRGSRGERVALVADALAVIATPAGPTVLLVEIDMGTVSVARMRTKYEGYAAWWRGGGPERRFGAKSLRVLTIAKHEARTARLRAAAAERVGSDAHGLLWFASADVLDPDAPEKLLANAFCTARPDAKPLPLFPGTLVGALA
ncbi:MAG: replication-relaxation family protein, partial [Sandaracinaceae bacterium]|nr:replication-relaxation family protein [Sandaracinaceae bacterium]